MNDRTFSVDQAHRLEDPERLKFLPPGEVVGSLEIRPGMTVADIGAGTGYFTRPLAAAVGGAGRVFAVDFQTGMLDLLGKKLLEPGAPSNITLIHGSAEHTMLDGSCADMVFLSNIWHELDDHGSVLREIARILKPEGRLAVLDWRPEFEPPPGPPSHHRIARPAVIAALEANAWKCDRAGNVGRFSFLIIARRDVSAKHRG
jgi:ubiquinone/menaquinone biosynthesis C-methylase UbiE